MIATVISVSNNVSSTIPYLEDRTHDAEVIHVQAKTPLRSHAEAWMPKREGIDGHGGPEQEPTTGIRQLIAYMDDERKSGETGVRIPEAMIEEFEARAASKPNIRKRFVHIALTYSPEDTDKLTEEQIAGDVHDMIHALVEADTACKQERAAKHGYAKAPLVDEASLLHIAVRHREKDHQHVHVLACTIDANGNHLYLSRDYWTLRRFCVERERMHGLTPTRFRAHGATQAEYLPGAEARQSKLAALREQMQIVAGQAADLDDLRGRLTNVGIELHKADNGHHGWYVRDADGVAMQASDAGLVGRFHPDRIGVVTPKQQVREAAWEALDEAGGFDEFEHRLEERGIRVKASKAGQVVRFERAGGGWAPKDLGMKRAPKKDPAWWDQHREHVRKRPPKPAKPVRAPDAKPIRLIPRQPTTFEQLEAFVAERGQARDRVEARERAAIERSRDGSASGQPSTSKPAAGEIDSDAATKKRIEAAVAKSLDESKPFRQQSDPQTMSMRLRAKGVQTHYDDRTRGWYAGIGDVLVPLPTLAGKEPRPGMAMGSAPSPAAPRPVLEPVVDRPKAPSSGPTIPRPPAPPMPDQTPKRDRGPRR